MNRLELRVLLERMDLSQRGDERSARERMIALLDGEERCFERDAFAGEFAGHFTGSALVVNADGTRVLLHHHRKLDRWLQFGGHCDGDEDVLGVARREALEESGIEGLIVASERPFDLDIHEIPARGDDSAGGGSAGGERGEPGGAVVFARGTGGSGTGWEPAEDDREVANYRRAAGAWVIGRDAMETPTIETETQVMFFDTDCAAVVHNISYLRFIEVARTHLAAKIGMGLRELAASQQYPVVVRTEIDYRKPAVLGDVLVVHGRLETVERMRFWCAFEIKRPSDGALIVTSRQMLALVQMPEGRPIRLPGDWGERFGHLKKTAAQAGKAVAAENQR